MSSVLAPSSAQASLTPGVGRLLVWQPERRSEGLSTGAALPGSLSRPKGVFQSLCSRQADVHPSACADRHRAERERDRYPRISGIFQESSPRATALGAHTLPCLLYTQGSLLAIIPACRAQPLAFHPLPHLPPLSSVSVRAPRNPKHLCVENALESMKSIGNLMRPE